LSVVGLGMPPRGPQLITDRQRLPLLTDPNVSFLSGSFLAAQAEPLDQSPVPLHVGPPEVVQQTPPPADHLQQAPARVVVVLVHPQVLGELLDPPGEDGHLHL
jgi:hypothetical protein